MKIKKWSIYNAVTQKWFFTDTKAQALTVARRERKKADIGLEYASNVYISLTEKLPTIYKKQLGIPL